MYNSCKRTPFNPQLSSGVLKGFVNYSNFIWLPSGKKTIVILSSNYSAEKYTTSIKKLQSAKIFTISSICPSLTLLPPCDLSVNTVNWASGAGSYKNKIDH